MAKIVKNDEVKKLEKTIIVLDTLFEKGEECIHPFTGEVVLDNEYDEIKQKLFDIYPKSKIFKTPTVSTKVVKNRIIHDPPMVSINKCNGTEAEKFIILQKWIKESQKNIPLQEIPKAFDTHLKQNYSMSYKRDGISISLEYENGKLIRAGLRSKSGVDGEDVTDKCQYIKGIPQKLPLDITCIIRGELETPIKVFEAINKKLEEQEQETKANPRAHTAGVMNRKYAKEIINMGIGFTPYTIINLDNPPYKTEIERAIWANKILGLNFVKTIPFDLKVLEQLEKQHRDLEYLVDGVVISVNNLEYQEKLGRTGSSSTGNPKGKIAFKFADEIKNVIVKNIDWQTGRSLSITPVLNFDGVDLEGTTVSRCTAHNLGIIINNKIGIGSKVAIIKSGKIIPKIKEVIEPKGKVTWPDKCPACGENTEKVEGGGDAISLNCTNDFCIAKSVGNINHFLKVINVKGIAESTINKLINLGLVSKISDLYKLSITKLLEAGLTERTSYLILARLLLIPEPEQTKDNKELLKKIKTMYGDNNKIKIPMEKFFAGLGINEAGETAGRLLSTNYETFHIVRNLKKEELESLDGIGPISANNIYNYFKSNSEEIDRLLKYIEVTNNKKEGKPMSALTGKIFVLSGKLESKNGEGKEYFKNLIEEKGGICKSSVSKNTNFLVAGEGSGSKTTKAIDFEIPVLTAEDLEEMLEN